MGYIGNGGANNGGGRAVLLVILALTLLSCSSVFSELSGDCSLLLVAPAPVAGAVGCAKKPPTEPAAGLAEAYGGAYENGGKYPGAGNMAAG